MDFNALIIRIYESVEKMFFYVFRKLFNESFKSWKQKKSELNELLNEIIRFLESEQPTEKIDTHKFNSLLTRIPTRYKSLRWCMDQYYGMRFIEYYFLMYPAELKKIHPFDSDFMQMIKVVGTETQIYKYGILSQINRIKGNVPFYQLVLDIGHFFKYRLYTHRKLSKQYVKEVPFNELLKLWHKKIGYRPSKIKFSD